MIFPVGLPRKVQILEPVWEKMRTIPQYPMDRGYRVV